MSTIVKRMKYPGDLPIQHSRHVGSLASRGGVATRIGRLGQARGRARRAAKPSAMSPIAIIAYVLGSGTGMANGDV